MERKKRIMLVDTDQDFVTHSKALLEKASYEVVVAATGEECLQEVASRRPDLIILDLMMSKPDNGFEVSRRLRNSERTKKIPIVMVSSASTVPPIHLRPDKTWLPVDVIIEKPVEPGTVLRLVEKMLYACKTKTES